MRRIVAGLAILALTLYGYSPRPAQAQTDNPASNAMIARLKPGCANERAAAVEFQSGFMSRSEAELEVDNFPALGRMTADVALGLAAQREQDSRAHPFLAADNNYGVCMYRHLAQVLGGGAPSGPSPSAPAPAPAARVAAAAPPRADPGEFGSTRQSACVTMKPLKNSANGFWVVVNQCGYRVIGSFCYEGSSCGGGHTPGGFGPISPGKQEGVSGPEGRGRVEWRVAFCNYDLWVKGTCSASLRR